MQVISINPFKKHKIINICFLFNSKEIVIFTFNYFLMKQVKIFLFLLTFITLTSFTIHKFYISITQVNYVEKQQAIQITSRIFIDDLQVAINALSNTNIELASDREPKNITTIYENYLKNHLQFIVNNKEKKFTYIGSEYEKDLVIFYLEIENIDKINSLHVHNRLLTDAFSNQENIVKTKINKIYKSYILTKNKTKALVNF